ncbi:hypothetical protein VPHD480_0228 [Vibrio phage D480]|nr:hypothetical protein MYOV011v1_p0398 [Vibrio phage 6E35.1a]
MAPNADILNVLSFQQQEKNMKDYNQVLLNVNYTSGTRVAFWVHSFTYERSMSQSNITWDSSGFTPVTNDAVTREDLSLAGIIYAVRPLKLAMDFDTIESVFVLSEYNGEDGDKPDDAE